MKMQSTVKKLASALLAGTMLLTQAALLPELSIQADAASLCTVNIDKTYQTIKGFGGMNHPEWAGDLTEAQRATAFGNGENQLGLSICRVFVNDNSNQWNRALATAKYAQSNGAIVFASPWNPPSSMTETFSKQGDADAKRLKKSSYSAYADHLNNFVKYMKNNGVNLYAISIQNEPDWGFDWTWWTEDECVDFLANYGNKIEGCKVMSPESFSYKKSYYEKILANGQANANVDIWGTHFYGTSRQNMDFPKLENDSREIFMTEVYTDSKNDADVWPMALDVSENIHNGLVVGNMNAYVWWYIRRSYSPIKENGQISKRGYCMAQYSKFVRPGDIRIDATEQPEKNVYVSAYKNSKDQVTIVAINKSDSGYTQQFSLGGKGISDVDRWRTSANENLAKTDNLEIENGSSFWAQLPAKSVSTFVVTLNGGTAQVVEPEPEETTLDADGYYFHDTFENNLGRWSAHGSTELSKSGRSPYQGCEAMIVTNRTKAWMGAERTLSSAFEPGKSYSFSVNVCELDGEETDTYYLKLTYKDAAGETHYATIAEGTAPNGKYIQLSNEKFTMPADVLNPVIFVETADSTTNFYIDEAIGAPEGKKLPGAGIPELPKIRGDVNADRKFDVTDVVLLQKWLLAVPNTDLADWKAADLCEDDRLDVFDLCMMKRELIAKAESHISPEEYMAQISTKILNSEPSGATAENNGTKYGTYEKISFKSDVCGGRTKSFNVLLPAGYTASKKYPVLYVMHGYWGDEDALLDKGDASLRLRQIIGNAIASGEAEDMIVVFPDIYASATQDKCDGLNDKNNAAYDNFINELTKEIMPYMEQHYSIKTGRDNTAITGFSMGGRESLYIGLTRPDLFGYIGAMCPAPGVPLSNDKFKFGDVEPYLFFISAGSNDTLIYSTPEGYHNTLTANGTTHIWHYVNGGDHGGKTIRPHMYNFIRYIFKA